MNRKILVVFLLMVVLAIFGLGSCLSNKEPIDTANSKNNLDWEGVYTGTIPLDSGPGIALRIRLNRDQSFEMNHEYLDGSYSTTNWEGSFQWDDTGNIIKIDIIDAPVQYKVAKDKLIRLDVYNYVLTKVH